MSPKPLANKHSNGISPVLVGKYMFKGSIFQPAMLLYRRVNLFDMPLFLRYYRGAHGIVRPSRVVAPKLPADATWMYGKWTLCWCSSYCFRRSWSHPNNGIYLPFGKLSWQWKIHHLCIVVESPEFPGSSLFSIWLTVVTLLNLWPCGRFGDESSCCSHSLSDGVFFADDIRQRSFNTWLAMENPC